MLLAIKLMGFGLGASAALVVMQTVVAISERHQAQLEMALRFAGQ